MKENRENSRGGFTLIEILVVIAIIMILVSIIVPVAGSAKETALKRRAALEMQSIKVAVMQFQTDHRYMPWPPEGGSKALVGEDKWTTDDAQQAAVMELLTGNNPLKKLYLQIPEKSKGKTGLLTFVDPLGQPYQVGMDRNMDGQVKVKGTGVSDWDSKMVMEKVLVFCKGPPGKNAPMKTFDVTP